MHQLRRFWSWYKSHLLFALSFMLFIQILQIPHWIWSHSQFTDGLLPDLPLWLDYIIWSIDLIEIPALINAGMLLIAFLQEKHK